MARAKPSLWGNVALKMELLYRVDAIVAKVNQLSLDSGMKRNFQTRAGFIKEAVLDSIIYNEERVSHAYNLFLQKHKRREAKANVETKT